MAEPRGSDEQIEVAQDFARSPQPSALLAEDLGGLCIDSKNGDAAEKICEGLLIVYRTGGKIHALIQLCQGDDRHREPLIA